MHRSFKIVNNKVVITVINGDCIIELKAIKHKPDLIYCDLPFGITNCSWDTSIEFDKMWQQIERLAHDHTPVVFHSQQPFTSALVMSNRKLFRYSWVWEKSKATGFLNAKLRPLVAHEDILVFCKTKPVYYPIMVSGKAYNKGKRKKQSEDDIYNHYDVREIKSTGLRFPRSVQYFKTAESEGKIFQKTQKPVALCKYIIETYTRPGDLILDFTAGSGTVGIASLALCRNAILIEKSISHYRVIMQRLQHFTKSCSCTHRPA